MSGLNRLRGQLRENQMSGIYSVCAALLLAAILGIVPVKAAAADTSLVLDNGLEVILHENHGSPLVASMFFVRSGSRFENRFENGITHFLEHYLFDGTRLKSREELDSYIADRGGYINAFTREEFTCYFTLMPTPYAEHGLATLTDMLFNSAIPESELAKERQVVMEEIKRDMDSPGYAAGQFHALHSLAGTPYAQPVLGYAPFIENIPREAIIDYWRRSYRPDKMVLLIVGDFVSDAMIQTVRKRLGPLRAPTSIDSLHVPPTDATAISRLSGVHHFDTVAAVVSTYINLSIEAPNFGDSDYAAMDLLTRYLALDEVSPLKSAVLGGSSPMATELSIGLSTYDALCRLDIQAITDDPSQAEAIRDTVTAILARLKDLGEPKQALEGIRTSILTESIFNGEQLIYYGFLIGPQLMHGGWKFVQAYPDTIRSVDWGTCRAVAARWLAQPDYVATIIKPAGEGQTPFAPAVITPEDVAAHFDTAQYAFALPDSMPAISYPPDDTAAWSYRDPAQYYRHEFDNGLTLLVKTTSESQVFAVTILTRMRSALEPPDKAGLSDFVNRLLEKGTVTRDAEELSTDLSSIGADLTLYDNPWIPYDDHYTTPQDAFIKFGTIDRFARKGMHLLTEMVRFPAFDPDEIENVRSGMIGMTRRDAVSPSKVARQAFYEQLFAGRPYRLPVSGTAQSLAAVSREDLLAHHRRLFAPGNLIIAVAGPFAADTVVAWVAESFGGLPKSELAIIDLAPEPAFGVREQHMPLDKQQVSIYLGDELPGADSPDAEAIDVAVGIYSNRLFANLRERQGLAYSVGAGCRFDRTFGWYYATISTGTENFTRALEGIKLELEKLKLDGPEADEITRAVNEDWGRLLRSRLTSINQAYYLAANERIGRPSGFEAESIARRKSLGIDDMRRIFGQYFSTDSFTMTSAGTRP